MIENNIDVKSMEKLVLVTGMHRSGTSAMAGLLQVLGGYLGPADGLYEADQNNEAGYYERRDIVEFNDDILSGAVDFLDSKHSFFDNVNNPDYLGWLYGAWSNFEEIAFDEAQLATARKWLLEIIGKNNQLFYVVKDPRLSLLYQSWMPVFGCQPLVIVMVRSPSSVSRSLYLRDGIFENVGKQLWATYTKSAIPAIENKKRLILSYDELVENPELVVQQTIEFLEKNNISVKSSAVSNIEISSTLRHNFSSKQSCRYHYAYEAILKGDLKSLHALKGCREKDPEGWQRLLHIAANFRRIREVDHLTHSYDDYKRRVKIGIERLESHPVAGRVIKFVSWVKSDPSFIDFYK